MIRIWQAFSCNNSSAYRIVARFADPAIAADSARELDRLIATHAAEVDANPQDQVEPTRAQQALAEHYGFEWPEVLSWGSGRLAGNWPSLWTAANVVVVCEDYGSGFAGFSRYLAKRGAALDPSDPVKATLATMLFKWPAADRELTEAWKELAWRIEEAEQQSWSGIDAVALFCDGETGGLCCELASDDHTALATLKAHLAAWGVAAPSITLCDDNDAFVFARVARARCTACRGPLCYLDPRIHDIEHAQLMCKPCGGFYELEVLLEAT